MKFSIVKEHRDFFQKNGWIEFENLFSASHLEQLSLEIERELAARLKISIPKLHSVRAKEIYLHGHDLWRHSESIKRFITQSAFTHLVAELLDAKEFRLAWDQFIPSSLMLDFQEEPFGQLLKSNPTLNQMSSIRDLNCGVILLLNSLAEPSPSTLFPKSLGHCVFFKSSLPMPFEELNQLKKNSYLLVTYTNSLSSYVLNSTDPHTYSLKQVGYSLGQQLNEKWNPIVYRR